jgi:hypothetical protein
MADDSFSQISIKAHPILLRPQGTCFRATVTAFNIRLLVDPRRRVSLKSDMRFLVDLDYNLVKMF